MMLIFKLRAALLGLTLFVTMASSAIVNSGDAAVSGFSGTVIKDGKPFIDSDGISLKVFELKDREPAQAQLLNVPPKLEIPARDMGQVFGIALDNATPPNIYATTTAAYGLHIVTPDSNGDGIPEPANNGQAGATFMDGQFGPNGNAGSVWKIDGKSGAVTLFANLQGNVAGDGGAGLGNIVFDPSHYQLFVSDLDSGLIHQLDMNGNLLGTFDHGVDGRTIEGLTAVPDDGIQTDITNAAFDSGNSDTWGLTDIRRRVWGLAFFKNRLYYAVGDGPQIWSIGFNNNGGFAGDAKVEIKVVLGGYPVSDILFTPRGQMILAQRGGMLGSSDFLQFHTPSNNQVLRYSRDVNDQWVQQAEEYAIGFPPDHKNASGGVALSCDDVLWSTGDNLRNDQALANFGELVVHGLQGNELPLTRPRNVPPWASWFVDYDGLFGDDQKAGHVGDVEVFRDCRNSKGAYDWEESWSGWEPPAPDWVPPTTWTPPPWWPAEPDLELIKDDTQCTPDPVNPGSLLCTFTITVTNVGGASFSGFLNVVDNVLGNTQFVPPPGGSIPWNCAQPAGAGTAIDCTSVNPETLLPGTSETLDITVSYPPAFIGDVLDNCANIDQPGDAPGNNDDCGQGFGPGSDLEMLKTLEFCVPVAGGAECHYWLDVNNVGNAPFNNTLHILETLPAGATYIGVIDSSNFNWTCFPAGGSVDCWLWPATLPVGGNEWVKIAIFVPAGGPAGQENCVELGQPEHGNDPNINGNNSDCAPVTVPRLRAIQPLINFCPADWSLQQNNWQPAEGWEAKRVTQGKDTVVCGRKIPQKRVVCPNGWERYPSGDLVPEGWEVQRVGVGEKVITCIKPAVVVPPPVLVPPVYIPPVVPQRPHCHDNERTFYNDYEVPGWNKRRVSRGGETIWCGRRVHIPRPQCHDNEKIFYDGYKVSGWSKRRVSRGEETIWCGRKVHVPRPHCQEGERTFYNGYGISGWEKRRVSRGGETIWCGRQVYINDPDPIHINKYPVTRRCPRGTHKYHGRCVPNVRHTKPNRVKKHSTSRRCPKGTHRSHGRCVRNTRHTKPSRVKKHSTSRKCPRGTYRSHGKCIKRKSTAPYMRH